MATSPIDIHRRQIECELEAGNATEHTHRPALKDLVESLASTPPVIAKLVEHFARNAEVYRNSLNETFSRDGAGEDEQDN